MAFPDPAAFWLSKKSHSLEEFREYLKREKPYDIHVMLSNIRRVVVEAPIPYVHYVCDIRYLARFGFLKRARLYQEEGALFTKDPEMAASFAYGDRDVRARAFEGSLLYEGLHEIFRADYRREMFVYFKHEDPTIGAWHQELAHCIFAGPPMSRRFPKNGPSHVSANRVLR